MIEHLTSLNEGEYNKLKDAIPEITILIAGADGEIEVGQLEWAEKVTNIRSYNMDEELREFYKEVGVDFAHKLDDILNTMPNSVTERNEILTGILSQLNPILAKLNPEIASQLYKSYVSFAKHVAKASGGFLGFFAINQEEAKLIGLPMITPIEYHPKDEEEE